MSCIFDWEGYISATRADCHDLLLAAPYPTRVLSGSSCPFIGKGDDGRDYFIKTLQNEQGAHILVAEQIVAGCGLLLECPICFVRLMRIPKELDGFQLSSGEVLREGIAHASLRIPKAIDSSSLTHTRFDDNVTRQAKLAVLYDWCWGADEQWLYCADDEMKIYSHDHGYYFPRNGSMMWTAATLYRHISEPHQLPNIESLPIPREIWGDIADVLLSLQSSNIGDILRKVPESWPITTKELAMTGRFLDARRGFVVQRLRKLAG